MSVSADPETIKLGALLIVETASPLPLEHTRVNVHLSGLVASVTVNQHFSNPLEKPVELEYLFPLPQDAALLDFKIRIGDRLVQGDLRERQQAEADYQQARSEGKHAALLNQQRPNLFTIQIANVLPGEAVEASLQYEDRLTLRPGELEFVFPMGLTPRYHSPNYPEPGKVNPAYAHANDRVGGVEIELTADAGLSTGTPTSPSHTLRVDQPGPHGFSLGLQGSYIPDHDFVLRIPLAGVPVEIFARCGSDQAGSAVLIDWLPGEGSSLPGATRPREFVFVLDRSGSMSGEPIRQARNALRACLRILEPQDTFRVLLFDDRLEWYQPNAMRVSQTAIHQADQFLETVDGRGGTEIIAALEAALNLPADSERMRYILFLTDGAVSAEEQALTALRQKLGRVRIFTFGIGSSVNRSLLSRMALWGRGTAEFLQLDEDIEGAILRFQDKVAFPMLTDITLSWQNCQAWDIYPAPLPDLYAGQPLQLAARLKRAPQADARLHISGLRGTEPVEMDIVLPEANPDLPEAARLWARARIADLLDQSAQGSQPSHQARQEIISLALEHHLITPFTAFVAIDNLVVNAKGEGIVLEVAHPRPLGLSQDLFEPPARLGMSAFMPPAPSQGSYPPPMAAFPASPQQATPPDAAPQPLKALRGLSRRLKSMAMPASADSTPANEIRESQSPFPSDPEAVLRWLARTQEFDGSWNFGGVEFTAAALLVFVRCGNTLRSGYYRKQVRRAAEWLEKTPAAGSEAAAQALALAELGEGDQDPHWLQAARQLAAKLPASSSAFQQAVAAHILCTLPAPAAPAAPAAILTPEELRLAATLRQRPAQIPAWVPAHPDPLVKVWAAALTAEIKSSM